MVGQEKPLTALMALPWRKQLAFALLVFERMLPSLIAFSKDSARDASCYLKARDAAWAALHRDRDAIADQSLNDACVRNTPDTEEFSHQLTSYALNAALTMSEILQFTADGRADHVAYISTLATDSVYLYVSGLEPSIATSPERARKLAVHPLMQQELRRQEEDIGFLSGLPDDFDEETISALRARASTEPPCPPTADPSNQR